MLNYANEMTDEDLRRSFSETYILHNGVPVFVCMIQDRTAHVRKINGDMREVPVEELNFEQPDVGMFRYDNEVYYASRVAARQWRRGLRLDRSGLRLYRLTPKGESLSYPSGRIPSSVLAGLLLQPQPQHDTILCRDFARRGKWLFFRNIPLGQVCRRVVTSELPENIRPLLPEGYSYA